MASLASVREWHDETDVLVCGFGMAGSAAAIEAHDSDPTADVLLIEKMPETLAGGNARVWGESLLISKDVLQHLSNDLVRKFIRNNLKPGKYKWVILTNDRGSGNRDVASGGHRAIDLAAPPFEVKGLVDLPITFGNEVTKITSLLDLTRAR